MVSPSNGYIGEQLSMYLIKNYNQFLMRLTYSFISNQINTIDIRVQFSVFDAVHPALR